MQHRLAVFTFALVLLGVAICANGQQKTVDEFVSPMGRFGIALPRTSTNNYNSLTLKIGDDKLLAWVYRWALDSQQALVMYAIGKGNLESNGPLLPRNTPR